MKRALILMTYALCASCMTEDADDFLVAGGLSDIHTREQLIERDLQLAMASEGRAYSELSDPVRNCLADFAVSHAPEALRAAADTYLSHKSEASWLFYRRVHADEGTYPSAELLQTVTQRCEQNLAM